MDLSSRVFEVIDVPLSGRSYQVLYTFWDAPMPSDYAPETMHVHDFYELHASCSQPVRVRVEGELREIAPGEVLIIAPGTLHNAADPEARKLIFSYDVGEGDRANEPLAFQEPWRILRRVDTSRLEAIIDEVEARRPGYYDAMCAQFVLLLTDIARELANDAAKPTLRGEGTNYSTKFFLDAFFKMNVRWNYNKATLANMLHLSTRQLERKIMAEYGMTYREKVQQVRFQNARLLLTLCHVPPSQVAEMLGYADVAAFSRAFKKFYGVSPVKMFKCDMNTQK